ncbi:MAG: transcription antitermination factor NusB [Paludibacteraceae bacterium]|nr:transcription antitermination factor NusB [Paludibacteraceae bacterium]
MMTYRTLLRIKVMQLLYAFESKNDKMLSVSENELIKSIQKTTDLYFHLLNLSVFITKYAEDCIEIAKNKFRPTQEELNPNMKFVNNLFVKRLLANNEFLENIKSLSASWNDNPEVIKSIYSEIQQSDFYIEYMSSSENDFKEDKILWRNIFEKIIANNVLLDEALEDQCIYWNDDLELALSFVVKTTKQMQEETISESLLPKISREEDIVFAKELFADVILNKNDYRDLISRLSQHWDPERIAFMDILIMLIAISELVKFPTIPINVTINEYIEISKMYSTEKSHMFINGILDKAVAILKSEKKILKVESVKI